MEAKAVAKYIRMSPQKVRLVVDLVRGKKVEEAKQIGTFTGQLVEATLVAKRHPEQGYRSSLGILRLAKTYPAERMEAAARRALRARAYNSRSMESILKNQLDRLPEDGEPVVASALNPAVAHDNIRGAGYFDAVG